MHLIVKHCIQSLKIQSEVLNMLSILKGARRPNFTYFGKFITIFKDGYKIVLSEEKKNDFVPIIRNCNKFSKNIYII